MVKTVYCSQAFPRCDNDTGRLFIQPCRNVCDDFLNICRLNQIDDTVIGLLQSQNVSFDLTLLNGLTSTCSNATLFSDTDPCAAPFYPPLTPKCPCLSYTQVTLESECSAYVKWNLAKSIQPFISQIDSQIDSLMEPFLYVGKYTLVLLDA